jgi:hypothetical protein
MPDSLQEALNFGAGTAMPAAGDAAEGASGSGTSSNSGGSLSAPCACTCEEYEATRAEASAIKARIDAGGEAAMADLGRLNRCQASCQNEYLSSVFQAEKAAKEERELAQQAAEERAAADCDCSCEGIDRVVARGREIEAQFAAGGQVSTEELADLTRCSQARQQDMLNCAMRR